MKGRMVLAGLALALGGCRQGERGASLRTDVPPVAVDFVWSGALTPVSVRVVAGLRASADGARLVVRPEAEDSVVAQTAPIPVPDEGRIVRVAVNGLRPGTRYRYAFEASGEAVGPGGGAFRTPDFGPFSFAFAMGACAQTGSSRPVFDAVRERDPLFFLHLGDLHYEDITVAAPNAYRSAIGRVLRSPAQARLYRSVPVAYVWDDHDYGPNNSDGTAAGRTAARLVYQEMVPHYPLALGEGDGPIAQAFTIGRVRFVLTDLRSERDPPGFGDPAERTMLGARQKEWLKRELLAAAGRHPVIVWANTVPWIAPPAEAADDWGGYADERREIADFIRNHGVRGVVIAAGDAHMVAMDDGTNSDFATGGGAPIPVVHAAALDRPGSMKGGPYSEGAFPNDFIPPNDGQWVWVEVEDDGGPEVCLTWTGYRTAWAGGRTSPLVEMRRCFEAEPPPETLLPLAGP